MHDAVREVLQKNVILMKEGAVNLIYKMMAHRHHDDDDGKAKLGTDTHSFWIICNPDE